MQENVTILNQGAALERPTFSVNPLLIRLPWPCFAAIPGLLHDTRNCNGSSGNVFERPPVQEGLPSTVFTIQRIWHLHLRIWDLIFQRQMRKGIHRIRAHSPHFQRRSEIVDHTGSGMLNRAGGTFSHFGRLIIREFLLLSGILGNSLTLEF